MADLRVMTTTGEETILEEATVQQFKTSLRGALLRPGDDGYDTARKVFNAMIDKRPALIACCTGVADVINAVHFARAHHVLVAVRGGGHNPAGHSVCEGGLVIDLSPMKGMRVDPIRQTVHAQGGVTWGEFDRETAAFGLATTGGMISTTGIAGLTLGGGMGWLCRKYGLSCDNLLSVDVVTADGTFLTVNAREHEDLFWGIRGGGGNFGLITAFEYRLHPVAQVLGGFLVYPLAQAKSLLTFLREYLPTVPENLTVLIVFMTATRGSDAASSRAQHGGRGPCGLLHRAATGGGKSAAAAADVWHPRRGRHWPDAVHGTPDAVRCLGAAWVPPLLEIGVCAGPERGGYRRDDRGGGHHDVTALPPARHAVRRGHQPGG